MGRLDPQVLDVSIARKYMVQIVFNFIRYIPFNGGPRICIGQQFALTELAYTITRIFQKYERIENHMPAPPEYRTDIVLQPASPILVKFFETVSKDR